MGASGSALATSMNGKTIRKAELDSALLNLFKKQPLPDTMTFEELVELCKNKTDVFLTHNWGEGQSNHKRVAEVNRKLKERGLLTWFDEDKMEGDVKTKMVQGIDSASCVVVFITQQYMDKVDGENGDDNCKLEFGYASRRKTMNKMVPVVMESGCRNANDWEGSIGMILGGLLYVDMCDAISDARIDELHSRIMSIVGTTMQSLFEKCMKSLLEAEEPVTPVVAAAAAAAPVAEPSPVAVWLRTHAEIAPKAAAKIADQLLDANIASVQRLIKKFQQDANFLAPLPMDEDDKGDVIEALRTATGVKTSAVRAAESSHSSTPVREVAVLDTRRAVKKRGDVQVKMKGVFANPWKPYFVTLLSGDLNIYNREYDSYIHEWELNLSGARVTEAPSDSTSFAAVLKVQHGWSQTPSLDEISFQFTNQTEKEHWMAALQAHATIPSKKMGELHYQSKEGDKEFHVKLIDGHLHCYTAWEGKYNGCIERITLREATLVEAKADALSVTVRAAHRWTDCASLSEIVLSFKSEASRAEWTAALQAHIEYLAR